MEVDNNVTFCISQDNEHDEESKRYLQYSQDGADDYEEFARPFLDKKVNKDHDI